MEICVFYGNSRVNSEGVTEDVIKIKSKCMRQVHQKHFSKVFVINMTQEISVFELLCL